MDAIELLKKAKACAEQAELAEDDERVEFVMKSDQYWKLAVLELPSLLCHDSKIKCDIIFW